VLKLLVRQSLLQQSDQLSSSGNPGLDAWRDWSPAATFFHFSTKNLAYEDDFATGRRQLRRQAQNHPMPPGSKHYPNSRGIDLPSPNTNGELAQVLLARRTWRRFSPGPITYAELATLLGLTWGVQQWVSLPGIGNLALKTSPSGGALHPIEVYVAAAQVTGLKRGIYHYAAERHSLERVRAGLTSSELSKFLAGQKWFGSAAAVIFMTAVFPRSQWKYRSARAYRVVLTESGHLCQTFCLVATWLGLAPFCTLALADSLVERALGIDGVSESVLYAAGVGKRPTDAEWAPWPDENWRLPKRSKGIY